MGRLEQGIAGGVGAFGGKRDGSKVGGAVKEDGVMMEYWLVMALWGLALPEWVLVWLLFPVWGGMEFVRGSEREWLVALGAGWLAWCVAALCCWLRRARHDGG